LSGLGILKISRNIKKELKMKTRSLLKSIVIVCALCALGALVLQVSARNGAESPAAPQAALGTAFTYQGQLQDNGAPADGSYDFRFTLYSVADGGAPLAGTAPLTHTAVAVTKGQFTVLLDFGNIFANQQLYLEIAVRPWRQQRDAHDSDAPAGHHASALRALCHPSGQREYGPECALGRGERQTRRP
jgi:hypothetical protein